jgi:hypothetical protein
MSVPPHQYPNNRRDARDSAYVSRIFLYALQYLYSFTHNKMHYILITNNGVENSELQYR